VHPPPLTPEAMTNIEATLQHEQRRRAQYQPGLLSISVDGEPVGEFDVQRQEALRLRISRTAASVEVYGRDAEGPLLLAVFPVAGVGVYEARRTMTVLLSAAREEDGTLSDTIVELTYLESPWAALRSWWVAARQQGRRRLRGLVSPTIVTTAIMRGCQWIGRGMDRWLSTTLGRVLAPAVVSVGLVLLTLRLSPWPLVSPEEEAPALPHNKGTERHMPMIDIGTEAPIGITSRGPEPKGSAAKTLHELNMQGYNYEQAGDIPQAIATYQDAIDQVAYPLDRLAWLYYEQGKVNDALPLARFAVQLQPEAADYLHTLAVILCADGQHEEAIRMMERAARLQPGKYGDQYMRFQQGSCQ
jgi:hypothetical protein